MKENISRGVMLERTKIKLAFLAFLISLFAMPKSVWAQPPPTGCCVLPDLSCTITTEGICVDEGGIYQGDGSECTSDLCPDHYKCYDVLGMFGRSFFSSFFPPRVFLVDQFEEREAKVLDAETFCNPVNKEGEGIIDDTAHLTCYDIENSGSSFFSFFAPVRKVFVDNQFGVQRFIVAGARNLCVPSEKNNVFSELLINHYKCYNIIDSEPFLVPRLVDLADQFEEKKTLLLASRLFCNPVLEKRDKNGAVIDIFVDETAHLTCYDIFDETERFIFAKVSNQIDELLKLLLGKPEFLCVPSIKAECGDGIVTTPPEVCDDENNIDGDGCSADCTSDETCGNGIIDTAVGEDCEADTDCEQIEFCFQCSCEPDIG